MATLDTQIIQGREIDPVQWDAFIRQSPQGGLYLLHGYASTIAAAWSAVIVSDQGEWQAVMPFLLRRRWGLRNIPQPFMAQYWGICLAPATASDPQKVLSRAQKLSECILEGLPSVHHLVQNFSPHFPYALPLHWAGYKLSPRYTFHLDVSPSEAALWEQVRAPMRRKIRSARRLGYEVRESQDPSHLLSLLRANTAQGRDLVGTGESGLNALAAVCRYLVETGRGTLLEARDQEGKVVAVHLLGYFEKTVLYLTGATDPPHRPKGAASLLMWACICHAQRRGAGLFDFEGSMIEGVAHFFRKFGGLPVPYLQIRLNALPPVLSWISALRS